jgi:hypothetical protein
MRPQSKLRDRVFVLTYTALLIFAAQVISAYGQRSTGIVVESVDNYSLRNGPSKSNSIANGDGFLNNMVFLDSGWHLNARWTDNLVWDTDFMDRSIDPRGNDQANFDMPGTAISYFTGHGFCHTDPMGDGCSTQIRCTTTAACTNPNKNVGERMPGSCRFSPFPADAPRCCYMTDRGAATSASNDQFSGRVDYTSGPIRWGNGGTNMVVLDISCGILPTFWYQALRNANAGVHMIATIMVAGGDTADVSDRGGIFAMADQAYALARVSESWLDTMVWLPASEGGSCPGGGGGHGFNGCGCNIVVAMDSTVEGAVAHMSENWVDLQDDSKDSKGNSFYDAVWQCNYPLSSTNQTAWELP